MSQSLIIAKCWSKNPWYILARTRRAQSQGTALCTFDSFSTLIRMFASTAPSGNFCGCSDLKRCAAQRNQPDCVYILDVYICVYIYICEYIIIHIISIAISNHDMQICTNIVTELIYWCMTIHGVLHGKAFRASGRAKMDYDSTVKWVMSLSIGYKQHGGFLK